MIKVILEAIYDDLENKALIKTVDVIEQTPNEDDHLVLYYYYKDWIDFKKPKMKVLNIKTFNERFEYKGLLNELMDAKPSSQVKQEMQDLINLYAGHELAKHESDQNSDLLGMAYEISTLLVEWLEK